MSDHDENVNINFGETGASILGSKIRQVTRDYEKMRDLFAKGFTAGNKVGASGSGSIFDPGKIRDFGNEADKAGKKFATFTNIVNAFRAALVFQVVERFVGSIARLSDTYTNLQNKIKVVSHSHGEFLLAMDGVSKIARETRTSLESVATVYSRTARSIEGLGKSQEETLQFTRTLSKAVQVGGSTSVEAANAMIQLSQGLASGTLKGDELRSVLEQLPVVSQLISKHMGITVGQLREFGKAGKLTSEQVFNSIIEGTDEMAAKFAVMTPTISQGWQTIKNRAIEASGAFKTLSADIAKGLMYLADNFDTVITVARSLANVLGVVLAKEAIGALLNALKSLSLLALSNPYTAIALGITAAVGALLPFADKIKVTSDGIITLKDYWTAFSKKVVSDLNGIKEAFSEGFHLGRLHIYMGTLDQMLMRLAAIADFVHGAANPDLAVRVLAGDKSAYAEGHANRTGMTKYLASVKGEAADRVARGFQTSYADTNSRFNAWMLDKGPHTKTNKDPTAPGPKGKTFEDLQRELQDTVDVLKVGVLQIREAGSPITLPSQMTKKERLLADPSEVEVAKKLESTIDQLGKKQPKLTGKQVEALEDIIRQQQGIVQGKKDQLELEKAINDELDARLKREVDIINAQNDRSVELGKNVQQQYAEAQRARDDTYQGIRESLDPTFEQRKQQTALAQFRDDPKTIASEAAAAQVAIDRLTYSMSDLAVTFAGVADSMVKGFSDAIARAIVLNENIGDLMRNLTKMIAMQAISGLISTGLNAAIGGLGGLISSANMPASAGGGKLPGHAAGGYTGDYGANQAAGIVHGREYVLNAAATSSIGVGTLNAMNNGGASAMKPNIVINNNAAGDGYMARAEVTPKGEIQIMIDRAIHEKAPGVVAGAMSDRSSVVTKSMRRNFDVNVRNV